MSENLSHAASRQHASLASRHAMLVVCLAVAVPQTGCEKLPTFGDLTGGEAEEEQTQSLQTREEAATPRRPSSPVAPPPRQEPEPELTPAEQADALLAKGQLTTDRDLEQLVALESEVERITSLSLADSQVTAEGLAQLQQLPNLETLLLGGVPLDADGLAAVASVSGLRTLSLVRTESVDHRSLAKLSALGQLATLDLSSTKLKDEHLAGLAGLSSLEVLDISHTEISGHGLAFIRRGGAPLRVLRARVSRIKANGGMSVLEKWSTLESLDIGQCQLSDGDLPFVGTCLGLTSLSVAQNRTLTDAGMAHLQKLTGLRKLSVAYCPAISDRGLSFIRFNSELEQVQAEGTRCSIPGAMALRKFAPHAEVLLTGGRVTADGKAIADNEN